MLALPNELYRPILLHIDPIDRRKTLSSVALACRFLNSEAVPQLYHSFVEVDDPRTQVLFFKTVTSSPRLAQLVHTYVWRIGTYFSHKHEFWTLLPLALRSFVNLKELRFRTHGGTPAGYILRDCTFQLTHLDWDNRSDEAELLPFLSTQHCIKSLLIHWSTPNSPDMPSSVLQSLRSLSGDFTTIVAILPHCSNVTSLFWNPDMDEDGFSDLASPAFHNLRTFTFGGYFWRPHLSVVAPHLGNLVRFHLIGAQVDEYPYLLQLPNLEHLTFSSSMLYHTTLVPEGQEKEFTVKLFSALSKLRIIDMADHDQRWERGADNPIVVDRTELYT